VKLLLRILFLSSFLFLTHCASYTDETQELRKDYVSSKYNASLEKLEKSPLKTSNKDRLLYNLEKSMILDRMGDRKASRESLFRADKIVDDLYTTSITKTAATFFFNDSASDYEGEDYEKVAIHTILALSFLEDNDISGARVEAKKINSKLHEITQNYDPKYLHYKEDAFARFLSGLVYESMQNWDDAIIDYRTAIGIYSTSQYSKFYEGSVPESLVTSLYGVALKRKRNDVIQELKSKFPNIVEKYDADIRENPNGGDLIVLHAAGQVHAKEAKDFFLPIPVGQYTQVMRISYPVIEKQNIDWQNTQCGASVDSRYYSAANTANMNALAYQSLDDKRGRLILKNMARLIIKATAVYQAGKNFGVLGYIGANVAAAVTETADTRSWTLMPQAFYVNRIRLAPGKHSVETKTASKVTNLVSVDIPANTLKFLVSKS